MKTRYCGAALLTVFVLFFFLSSPAFPWWNTAHELVAQIAEDKLSATAKAHVENLLLVDVEYPGNLQLSRRSNTIVTCAPWADTIKGETDWRTIDQMQFYSALHFIDIPIPQDAVPSMEASKQRFRETISEDPVQNVDYAIKSAIKVLASTGIDQVQAATALRFLIHFSGDIHQPFHASDPLLNGMSTYGGNLVFMNSVPYFPSEKNTYSVEINGAQYNSAVELHAFWDAMGGAVKQLPDPTLEPVSSEDYTYLRLAASALDRKYAGSFDAEVGNPSVDDWAIESYYYANVYYTADIQVPHFVDCEGHSCFNNNLPYEEASVSVSEIRTYLGGHRLGNFLNTLFDPEAAVPGYSRYIQEILADSSITSIYSF